MQPAYQQRPRQTAHRPPPHPQGRQHLPSGKRPRAGAPGQNRPASSAQNQAQVISYKRARRKRLRRRRALFLALCVLVLALLVGGVILVGNLLRGKAETPQNPVAVAQLGEEKAGVENGRVAVSLPKLVLPSLATGPYDEGESPLLFNFDHAIPSLYSKALLDGGMTDIGSGQQMANRAAAGYNAMAAAAKAEGITLVPLSGYRSNERQTTNYEASIQRYLEKGFSNEEAVRRTEGYYALPGTSEHEAGLAIDIGDAKVPGANIQDSFEKTQAYTWLQEHAEAYGFILRYREEDFDITRIHYEPWHYRYVGANHAAVINQRGITLEEYMA